MLLKDKKFLFLCTLLLILGTVKGQCLYNDTHCQCQVASGENVCLRYQSGRGTSAICIADKCDESSYRCDCRGGYICPLSECKPQWQPVGSGPIVIGDVYHCEKRLPASSSSDTTDSDEADSTAVSICVGDPKGMRIPSLTPSPYGSLCNQNAGICCSEKCLACGEPGCEKDNSMFFKQDMSDQCCQAEILASGRSCGEYPAPCILDEYSQTTSSTTNTPSSSSTPTASLSSSPIPSLSTSPIPSLSISPTPPLSTSPTPSLSTSPTPSLSTSPTPSLSTSPTPSLSTSPTPSLSTSPTPSLSTSPTPSLSISPTPSSSTSPTPSSSISLTPSPSTTATPSMSMSVTPSSSMSATPFKSDSMTPSPSMSESPSPSISLKETPSNSISPLASSSPTPSPIPSSPTAQSFTASEFPTVGVPTSPSISTSETSSPSASELPSATVSHRSSTSPIETLSVSSTPIVSMNASQTSSIPIYESLSPSASELPSATASHSSSTSPIGIPSVNSTPMISMNVSLRPSIAIYESPSPTMANTSQELNNSATPTPLTSQPEAPSPSVLITPSSPAVSDAITPLMTTSPTSLTNITGIPLPSDSEDLQESQPVSTSETPVLTTEESVTVRASESPFITPTQPTSEGGFDEALASSTVTPTSSVPREENDTETETPLEPDVESETEVPWPSGSDERMCNMERGVCCEQSCAVCAKEFCGEDSDGNFNLAIAENCCSEYIYKQNRNCAVDAPPCVLPAYTPGAFPSTSFTGSVSPSPSETQTKILCNEQRGVCCDTSCKVCAESECSTNESGQFDLTIANQCCAEYIYAQAQPCDNDKKGPCVLVNKPDNPQQTVASYGPLCNNDEGVCCEESCTQCTGENCGNDEEGEFQTNIAQNCCAGYIKPSGRMCGQNAPPCIIP